MSDPVAKDVEDVLSSIRRLVSDAGPETGSDVGPSFLKSAGPKNDVRDALILTSALRVDAADDAADTDGEQDDAKQDDAVQDDVAVDDGETLDEVLDRVEDELTAESQDAEESADEEPTMDDAADTHDARSDLGSLRQAVSGAFMGEPVMPAVVHRTHNVKKAEDVSSALGTTKNWGSRPPEDYYEDEELAASGMPEWQDDLKDEAADVTADADQATDDAADGATDVQTFRDDASDEGEDWTDEVEPEAIDPSLAADAAHEEPAPEDTASVDAAPETDVKKDDISDEYEWDEEGEDAEETVNIATFRHTPVDAAQRFEPTPLASEVVAPVMSSDDQEETPPADDVAKDAAADDQTVAQEDGRKPIDLSDLDEAILDEETLRELVSDIVRKELTGELGERITRNVRKLVRREIHRALLTREFD